jgi:hypothetical protein
MRFADELLMRRMGAAPSSLEPAKDALQTAIKDLLAQAASEQAAD